MADGVRSAFSFKIANMIDFQRYGGKRAYFAHLRARVLFSVGFYNSAPAVDWGSIKRLAFVCQGNICRSPYAAERAKTLGLRAISFGISAVGGACANESASRVARARGIDLSAHRSARFQATQMAPGDLILVFEPAHLRDVMDHNLSAVSGVTLLGLYTRPVWPHIYDPYGRSDSYFHQCFSVIDLSIQELAKRLSGQSAPASANSIRDATATLSTSVKPINTGESS